MAQFNPDFWEVSMSAQDLDRVASDRALWFETDEDRRRRYAMQEFYSAVKPTIMALVDSTLTCRQRDVVKLYFIYGKSQEDIAEELGLTQSTVSRHLFGTMRNGRKVGGALTKLKRLIDDAPPEPVVKALSSLQTQLSSAAA